MTELIRAALVLGAAGFVIYIFDFHARRERSQVRSMKAERLLVFTLGLAFGCLIWIPPETVAPLNRPTIASSHRPAVAPSPTVAPFIGSKIKGVYHTVDCRYAAFMEHAEWFQTAEDAEADGKQPCKVCLPVLEVASLRDESNECP